MDVELICEVCKKEFLRRKAEATRNAKLGRPIYCSLKCAGKRAIENIPLEKRYHPECLKKGSKTDELSPFRHHLKCMKNRAGRNGGQRKPVFVTLEDLKEQWEKQKGICPYTGWQLKNADSTTIRLDKTPDRASVDRIDSNKPYVKENIQFIALMAQYAKNDWQEEDLVVFGKAITEHRV